MNERIPIAYLICALCLACGGAPQAEDPRIEECRATFCPRSSYQVQTVAVDFDLPEGHADFLCVCWCPTEAEKNRYMGFFTPPPPQPSSLTFADQKWAAVRPRARVGN